MKQNGLKNLLLCLCLKAKCLKYTFKGKATPLTCLVLLSVFCTMAQIPLRVTVYDKFTRQPIAATKVTLQELTSMRELTGVCNDSGFCSFKLQPEARYRMEVMPPAGGANDDYMGYSCIVATKDIAGKNNFVVELERVKHAESGLLPAIYFESNQPGLSAENEAALKNLLQMLSSFPSMQIEIGVYCDCREAADLAGARAQALKSYLAQKGGAKQVTVKEFGNVRPLNQCNCSNKNFTCPEDKYKENRRAEFKVISF